VAITHLHLDMAEAGLSRRTLNLMQVIWQLGAWHLKDRHLGNLGNLSLNHRPAVVNDPSNLSRLEVLDLCWSKRELRSAKVNVHCV
jgi:hypothetical protein